MMNMRVVFYIILISLILYFFIAFIIDYFGFCKFDSRLKVGTVLQNSFYDFDDDFAPLRTFTVTVTQVGEKRVKICYSDGSVYVMDKYSLYAEKWKIIKE